MSFSKKMKLKLSLNSMFYMTIRLFRVRANCCKMIKKNLILTASLKSKKYIDKQIKLKIKILCCVIFFYIQIVNKMRNNSFNKKSFDFFILKIKKNI